MLCAVHDSTKYLNGYRHRNRSYRGWIKDWFSGSSLVEMDLLPGRFRPLYLLQVKHIMSEVTNFKWTAGCSESIQDQSTWLKHNLKGSSLKVCHECSYTHKHWHKNLTFFIVKYLYNTPVKIRALGMKVKLILSHGCRHMCGNCWPK